MLTRVSRRVLSTLTAPYVNGSCSSLVGRYNYTTLSVQRNLEKLRKPEIPGDFVKWGSLGSIRTSKFATGFTPLQAKSLDSIIDIERAKKKSPEELADVWDDVISFDLTDDFFVV